MKVEIEINTAKQLLYMLKYIPCNADHEQVCTICELEDSLNHVLAAQQIAKPVGPPNLILKSLHDLLKPTAPPTSEGTFHA